MQFVYALINFLILAALLWLFGRKTISSIFNKRSERINHDLDEAEKIEASVISLPEIPDDIKIPIESLECEEIDDIKKESSLALEKLKKQTENEKHNMRREMLTGAKKTFGEEVKKTVTELLTAEPALSALRAREKEFAELILECIKLTPGDMAYLKYHDVLYVTLTSAYPLSEDIVNEIGNRTTKLLSEVGGKTSYWVKTDPELIGGLRLRIGDTVYDCTAADRLYNFERTLDKRNVTGDETPEELLKIIENVISDMKVSVNEFQLGRVISISDGICWLDGLADIMYGEVIEFECGERGMVLDIETDRIGCIVYGKYEHIESGSRVRRVGRIASVPVGDELLGRVVDPLGHSLDGKGRIWSTERRPIECKAPGIPDRAAVSRPLHTGIKAIDSLVPIGRGQRELIIGDRHTGKTSIAIDAIINQKGKNVPCIYVAIGQKDTTVADIREKLEKYGAMDYTVIVCAPASSSASLQYIAPFAGAAMGEYFMYGGRDVLIVYDDLSKHAVAYRELSLLLHRPSGREAYPGDVFYLHARLLERSAQLSDALGGGSMTALPIIETQAGDISAYIPTNVISITDGQIFLETDLFNEGQRPAVNVGLSVSRVGSAAQTKLMKQVSASLRMSLAQYRELAGFAQFGSDVDEVTKKALAKGERMMAALRQRRYAPLSDWRQSLLIYAVSEGYAASVSPDDMEIFEEKLYAYFNKNCEDLVEKLKSGAKMSNEIKERIHNVLDVFAKTL